MNNISISDTCAHHTHILTYLTNSDIFYIEKYTLYQKIHLMDEIKYISNNRRKTHLIKQVIQFKVQKFFFS